MARVFFAGTIISAALSKPRFTPYEVLGLRRSEEYSNLIDLERSAQKAPWAKIGLQLATGSGKTKVMSLLMTWAHLHWHWAMKAARTTTR